MVFKIKEIRKSKGMTQAALSRVSGVAREQINRYENGKVIPDVFSLVKLRNALGCRLDDLVSDAQ